MDPSLGDIIQDNNNPVIIALQPTLGSSVSLIDTCCGNLCTHPDLPRCFQLLPFGSCCVMGKLSSNFYLCLGFKFTLSPPC